VIRDLPEGQSFWQDLPPGPGTIAALRQKLLPLADEIHTLVAFFTLAVLVHDLAHQPASPFSATFLAFGTLNDIAFLSSADDAPNDQMF
jgi:hypothetical protein